MRILEAVIEWPAKLHLGEIEDSTNMGVLEMYPDMGPTKMEINSFSLHKCPFKDPLVSYRRY